MVTHLTQDNTLYNHFIGGDSSQVQFVMFKEPCRIQFSVKDSNERQGWLQWLARATAQSYKPCSPLSTTSSEGIYYL